MIRLGTADGLLRAQSPRVLAKDGGVGERWNL